jgi:hypothetical protein
MTLVSVSASIIRRVIVVFPEPVPPHIPIINGLLSSGGRFSDEIAYSFGAASQAGDVFWLLNAVASQARYLPFAFLRLLSSISACAAASRATPTRNGEALT